MIARNNRNPIRVHVSYRTFSHGCAFQPDLSQSRRAGAGGPSADGEGPTTGFGGADSITHSAADRPGEHQRGGDDDDDDDDRVPTVDVARDAERNDFAGAFHRGDNLFIQRLGTELFHLIDCLRHSAGWQGTQWNRIEHRLFAFITQNWRGKPLVSYRVIVQLIGATTTEPGLRVCCEIDGNLNPRGVKVAEQEMQAINITRDEFPGEWNYTISPNQQPP